jgi:hypothetical protein
MSIKFTNAETVLFKATFQFAINVEKLTESEATEKAMNKVISKRALAKKIAKSECKFLPKIYQKTW